MINNKLDDLSAQIDEQNHKMLEELKGLLAKSAIKGAGVLDAASREGPPSAVMASNVTTTSSVSEQQVESLASRYGIKLPSISTDDDDSSTKENVSLQANNILKQRNAELIEQIAVLKQAHASTVVEKEQLKKEFQTITSPTRKRPEDLRPTPSRQTARQKRAETQSINNRKTGRVRELRSRSCLQSERNLTLRQTRSQSRLAEQG